MPMMPITTIVGMPTRANPSAHAASRRPAKIRTCPGTAGITIPMSPTSTSKAASVQKTTVMVNNHPPMSLTLLTSSRFADHLTPPGHPERVDRHAVMQVVASEFRQRGGSVVEPRAATDEEITRIHDRDYLTLLRETAGRAVSLDADTFTSPETYEVARLAAGAAVSAVDRVIDGDVGTRALALVRPPG